jgi:hypothetical protein
MTSERFALALRQLEAGDWLVFERFAAEFLAVEFPSLRTMAATSGDKGRDAQLFVVNEAPKTAFQYSVTKDWATKIRGTAKRLSETMPKVTRLIYCTNQEIGPAADDLVEELRRQGVAVDIRDHSWFVARENTAAQRAIAAEDLARLKVDPLLSRNGLREVAAPVLADDSARVALLHLTLEGYDESSDRNLTKSCFEALVLAALHGTSAESPKPQAEIHAAVKELVPSDDDAQIGAHVLGAIRRLSAKNGPIKHISKMGAYHLAFNEQKRVGEATTRFLAGQRLVEDELARGIANLGLNLEADQVASLAASLRGGIEEVLLHRGEEFARAARGEIMNQVDVDEVLKLLTGRKESVEPLTNTAAAEVIFSVLENPSRVTQAHLGRLADGYTLFAFLRQTPDVQKTMVEIFSGGEVWLDTTVVLPLFAETLIDDPLARHFTVLLSAALDAGFRLYVTDGIVEEIERHLNRSLQFARILPDEWRSGVPFVYAAFALSGRPRGEFHDWLSEFRGKHTPEEDVKDYLLEVFGIGSRNLLAEAESASIELRGAVQEIWHEAHERRRQRQDRADMTMEIANRLVAHDVECSVGVMQLRKGADRSPTGYTHWWLTLDRIGFSLHNKLEGRLLGVVPPSPALSPDFLSQLLRLGPLRSAIETEKHVSIPVLATISGYESIPPALIELADSTRRRFEGQSERVVRREVRDALNTLRWRQGVEAEGGVRGAEERVKARLEAQAHRSA